MVEGGARLHGARIGGRGGARSLRGDLARSGKFADPREVANARERVGSVEEANPIAVAEGSLTARGHPFKPSAHDP